MGLSRDLYLLPPLIDFSDHDLGYKGREPSTFPTAQCMSRHVLEVDLGTIWPQPDAQIVR